MRPTLLVLACLCFIISSAQKTVDVTKQDVNVTDPNFFFVVNGQPFVSTKFVRVVEGSPYFSDAWMSGIVMIGSGKQYFNIALRLELISNELHFIDSNKNEMIATGDLKQIKLTDTINQKVYTFIHSAFIDGENIPRGWFQLLADGKEVALFKQYLKDIQETQPYGAATYEQHIMTHERYMVLYKNNFTEIKKTRDIAELFVDKKTEIQKYISEQKPSVKSDTDLIGLVNFYNSLHK
jgi:hypothetical protein